MAVTTEMHGRVMIVSLDRPEARNAFDAVMIEELTELFERLSAREPPAATTAMAAMGDQPARPHAILLQSVGEVFCAGADLPEMQNLGKADFETNLQAALRMGAMFRAIRLCPAPVVARVQGPAYGGGVGLACACDIVVAAQQARFAFSEVRLGLVAGVIAPLVIGRLGQAAARTAFLTGDPIRAVDAYRLGLVDRLASQEGLDAAVQQTLISLLKGGPAALGRIKSLLEGTLSLGFDRSAEFSARMIAEARTSPEAQAALKAFLRKEPAPWARDVRWPPEEGAGA